MKLKFFFILFLVLICFPFIVGEQTNTEYSFNLFTQPTFNNNTALVNASEFWDTVSLGALNDANSSQFQSDSGTLSIQPDFDNFWIRLAPNNLTTRFTGDQISTTGEGIFGKLQVDNIQIDNNGILNTVLDFISFGADALQTSGNVTASQIIATGNVDGGDVNVTLRNTAAVGSTDETVSIVALTAPDDFEMGEIVFGRIGNYDPGKSSFIEFHTVDSGTLERAILINEKQLVTLDENMLIRDNKLILFGGGSDASIGYDTTNLIIDPDLVGVGKVLIGATGDDDLDASTITLIGDLILDGDSSNVILGDGQDASLKYQGFAVQLIPDINGLGFLWVDGSNFSSVDFSASVNPFGSVLTKRSTDDTKNVFGLWVGAQFEPDTDTIRTAFGANIFSYTSDPTTGPDPGDLTKTTFSGGLVANFIEVRHQSGGTVAQATNIALRGQTTGGGDITDLKSIWITDPTVSGGGSIGTATAIWIDDITTATIDNAIVLDGDDEGGRILFGGGQDAGIDYDGVDFLLSPKLVGSGRVKIAGGLLVNENLEVVGNITAVNITAQNFFGNGEGLTGLSTEKTWAISQVSGAGSHYLGGFYDFNSGDDDFNPSVNFGTANAAHGSHFFIVTAGGDGAGDTTINVSGTSITDDGVRTASDFQVLTITQSEAAGSYHETSKKWIGQVTIVKLTGNDVQSNYGFAKYWDNNNNNFTVTGVEVTWTGGSNDANPDILIRHHKNSGWTYNVGSTPTPPTAISSMSDDYVTEIQVVNGENGAYKRSNLSTFVIGNNGEGTIVELVTTAGSGKTFEIGNFILRIKNE